MMLSVFPKFEPTKNLNIPLMVQCFAICLCVLSSCASTQSKTVSGEPEKAAVIGPHAEEATKVISEPLEDSTVTVGPGETLQTISQRLYGSSKKWPELYAENRDTLRNVDSIPVGTKLRIPNRKPLSPPDVKSTEPTTLDIVKVTPPAISHESDTKTGRVSIFDLRLFSGVSYESNSLKGGGFQSALPAQRGTMNGAELLFTPSESNLTYRMRYRRIETRFSTPSGYSPSEMTSTQTEIAPSLNFLVHKGESESFVRNIHLGLGYTFATRETVESTPNAVLTNQSSRGLSLNAGLDHDFSTDFSAELTASAYLPNSFYEKGAVTGNHRSSLGWEFQLAGAYAVSAYVQISLGIGVIQQSNQFSGTGGRGSIDGQEISRTITLPLELRIHPW